jgi:hypothetical protein
MDDERDVPLEVLRGEDKPEPPRASAFEASVTSCICQAWAHALHVPYKQLMARNTDLLALARLLCSEHTYPKTLCRAHKLLARC